MQVKIQKKVYDKLKQMSIELDMPMAQCINMLVTQWIAAKK